MPDAPDKSPFAAWLPANRREIIILVLGAALALGASRIPGVTFEPEELSTCKLAVVKLEGEVSAAHAHEADLDTRLTNCWQRYRERTGGIREESTGPYDDEPVNIYSPGEIIDEP